MRYQDLYQFCLIFFAFLVLFGVGVFVYHELFPQYKIYQYAYKDLERFRSSYTGTAPAPFITGIKQILIPNETGGPEIIDRCISCHVAMDLPHFSPTRVARDVNNKVMVDAEGNPILEPNPDYVWGHLQEQIDTLKHPAIIEHLRAQGKTKEADERIVIARELEELKTVRVEGKDYNVEKVIQMHPLIGAETHPFEYHSMEEYGCTSCHSGNGQALVAKRAHGPVFDGEYEPSFEGHKPQFTEVDDENDPRFSKMYNHKPGHDLIFQTTPLLTGPLLAAKCVQCHQPVTAEVASAIDQFTLFTDQKKDQIETLQKGLENDKRALISLLTLNQLIEKRGREGAIDELNEALQNYRLSSFEIDALEGQLAFVQENEETEQAIENHVELLVGTEKKAQELLEESVDSDNIPLLVQHFLDTPQQGSIGAKQKALKEGKVTLESFERSQEPLSLVTQDKELVQKMQTNVDRLITSYTRGKELFISQACYACHRIAGFSRSSVGPELTKAGDSYPWYIKESIVWPQADLPSSTMPNFRLDHTELADLMTFLMAQKGETKAISEVDYQIRISEWEKGEKMPWEEPVDPPQIRDVRAGQLVFAAEGCASCHSLQGFVSNSGFSKKEDLIEDKEWFYTLFPEQIQGSTLAKRVEEHAEEIDKRIVHHMHEGSILEEIEERYPELIIGFYTNFRFASRAYNTLYADSPKKLAAYKDRLHRVLMVYIQEYGLGRDIAPHLSYSGVYRDNAWLLGHFHNPPAYTAKSIMPVMPFDDTKFYMLNHMLHVLGRENRDSLREIWRVKGFNPALAYDRLCSSCHGENRQGNGIISEWIYPIPKNLRNPIFLRNLTKERAIESITHGVSGTPMPPWGESVSQEELGGERGPVLTREEIVQLVDWLYQGVPSDIRTQTTEHSQKWSYSPADVIQEMEKERDLLQPAPPNAEDTEELVHAYFEVRPNPIPSPDKELYYIREIYYTPKNLQEGKEYYEINCATCHGKEGTGTGLRATSMVEAKPRMLTNLPWIRTRDDMRLLRSIKFGVPGTAMTPWGDQTTSSQRMQLVMFIRELTRTTLLQDDLEELLYDVFNRTSLLIEEARIEEYKSLDENRQQLRSSQEKLFTLTESEDASSEAVGNLYSETVKLKKEVEEASEKDAIYQKLIDLLERERTVFATLGAQLIAAKLPDSVVHNYFELVRHAPLVYSLEDGKLILKERSEKQEFYLQTILTFLDQKIASYQVQIDAEEQKIHYPERGKKIQELMNEQGTYINLRTKLVVGLSDAQKLREQQQETYKSFFGESIWKRKEAKTLRNKEIEINN